MTMTSDIQERLRATKPHTNHGANSGLCHEAADTIDSLLKRMTEVDLLLTELIDGPSRGEFYGIGPTLRAKLETIRCSARAALSDGIVKG